MGELPGWGGVLLVAAVNLLVFVHMIRHARINDNVILERARVERSIFLARSVPAGVVLQLRHSDGSLVIVDACGLAWHDQGRKPQRG